MTCPEPTIIGNCEGWKLIVGKKPARYSPEKRQRESLHCCNMNFMHSLLTILSRYALDNLWVNCGRPVNPLNSSRIVDCGSFHMPVVNDYQGLF